MNEKRVYKTPTTYQYLLMKQVTIVFIVLSACAISAHALPLFNMFSNANNADTDTRGRNLVSGDVADEHYIKAGVDWQATVDHQNGAATVMASIGHVENAKVDVSMGLISGPQDIYMGTFEDDYTYYEKTRFQKEQGCFPRVYDFDTDTPVVYRDDVTGELKTFEEHKQFCADKTPAAEVCDATYEATSNCKTACEQGNNLCKWGGCERQDQAVAGIFTNVIEEDADNNIPESGPVTIRNPVVDRDDLKYINMKCRNDIGAGDSSNNDCEKWGGRQGQRSYVEPEDYCDLVTVDSVLNCYLGDCHNSPVKDTSIRFGNGLSVDKVATYNWASMQSFVEGELMQPQAGRNKIDFLVEDYDILDQQCYTTLGNLEDEFDDVECKEAKHNKLNYNNEPNNYKHSHFSTITQAIGTAHNDHGVESRYPDQEFCIDEAQKTVLVQLFGCAEDRRKDCAGEPKGSKNCAGGIDHDELHDHTKNDMTVSEIFNKHKNLGYGNLHKDTDYVCTEAERNVADVLSDYLDKADLDITQACKNAKKRYHAATKAYLDFVNPDLLATSDGGKDDDDNEIKEENVWLDKGNLYSVLRQSWRIAEYTVRSAKLQEMILDRFLKFKSWTLFRFAQAGSNKISVDKFTAKMDSLISSYHGIAEKERLKVINEMSDALKAVNEAKDFAAELAATQAAEAVAVVTVKIHAKKKIALWQQLETMLESNFADALQKLGMDKDGKNREHTYNNYGETNVHKPREFEWKADEIGGEDNTIGDHGSTFQSTQEGERVITNAGELEKERNDLNTVDAHKFSSEYDELEDDATRKTQYTMSNSAIDIDLTGIGCDPSTCDNVYTITKAHIPEDNRVATCKADNVTCTVTPASSSNTDQNVRHEIEITGQGDATSGYDHDGGDNANPFEGDIHSKKDHGAETKTSKHSEDAIQFLSEGAIKKCDATHTIIDEIKSNNKIKIRNNRLFETIDISSENANTLDLHTARLEELLEDRMYSVGVGEVGHVVLYDACNDGETNCVKLRKENVKSLEDVERLRIIFEKTCNVKEIYKTKYKANVEALKGDIATTTDDRKLKLDLDTLISNRNVALTSLHETVVECDLEVHYRTDTVHDIKRILLRNTGQSIDSIDKKLETDVEIEVQEQTLTYDVVNDFADPNGIYNVPSLSVFGTRATLEDIVIEDSNGDGIFVFDGSASFTNVQIQNNAENTVFIRTDGGHDGKFKRVKFFGLDDAGRPNQLGALIQSGPTQARNGGNTITVFEDIVGFNSYSQRTITDGFFLTYRQEQEAAFRFLANTYVSLNGKEYKNEYTSTLLATECNFVGTTLLYSSAGSLHIQPLTGDLEVEEEIDLDNVLDTPATGKQNLLYLEFNSNVIQTYVYDHNLLVAEDHVLDYVNAATEIRDKDGNVIAHTSANNDGVNTIIELSGARDDIDGSKNIITTDHTDRFSGTIKRTEDDGTGTYEVVAKNVATLSGIDSENDGTKGDNTTLSENFDTTIINQLNKEGNQIFTRSNIRCGYNSSYEIDASGNDQWSYVAADDAGKYVLGMEWRNNIVCQTRECTDEDQERGCKVRQTCEELHATTSLDGYSKVNLASYCRGSAEDPTKCDVTVGGADRERCFRANSKCSSMVNPDTRKYLLRTPQLPVVLSENDGAASLEEAKQSTPFVADTAEDLTAIANQHVKDTIIKLDGADVSVLSLQRVNIVGPGTVTVTGLIDEEVTEPLPSTVTVDIEGKGSFEAPIYKYEDDIIAEVENSPVNDLMLRIKVADDKLRTDVLSTGQTFEFKGCVPTKDKWADIKFERSAFVDGGLIDENDNRFTIDTNVAVNYPPKRDIMMVMLAPWAATKGNRIAREDHDNFFDELEGLVIEIDGVERTIPVYRKYAGGRNIGCNVGQQPIVTELVKEDDGTYDLVLNSVSCNEGNYYYLEKSSTVTATFNSEVQEASADRWGLWYITFSEVNYERIGQDQAGAAPVQDKGAHNVIVDSAELNVEKNAENILLRVRDGNPDPLPAPQDGAEFADNIYTGKLLVVRGDARDVHFQQGSDPISHDSLSRLAQNDLDQILPGNYISVEGELNGEPVSEQNKLPSTTRRCADLICKASDIDTCFITKELCFSYIKEDFVFDDNEDWRETLASSPFPTSDTKYAGQQSCFKDDIPNQENLFCAKEFCDEEDYHLESQGGHRGTCCVGGNPQTCEHHRAVLTDRWHEHSCRENGKGDYVNGGHTQFIGQNVEEKCTGPGVQSCYTKCCIQSQLVDDYLFNNPRYVRKNNATICEWEVCEPGERDLSKSDGSLKNGRDSDKFMIRMSAKEAVTKPVATTGSAMPDKRFLNLNDLTRCKGRGWEEGVEPTGACDFAGRDFDLTAPFERCVKWEPRAKLLAVDNKIKLYTNKNEDPQNEDDKSDFYWAYIPAEIESASGFTERVCKKSFDDNCLESDCYFHELKTQCPVPEETNTHYPVRNDAVAYLEETSDYHTERATNAVKTYVTGKHGYGVYKDDNENEVHSSSACYVETQRGLQIATTTQYTILGPRNNTRCQRADCEADELLRPKLTCESNSTVHDGLKNPTKYYAPRSPPSGFCKNSEFDTCDFEECFEAGVPLKSCKPLSDFPAWDTASNKHSLDANINAKIQNVRHAVEKESADIFYATDSETEGATEKRYCKNGTPCTDNDCWVQKDCKGTDIIELYDESRELSGDDKATLEVTDECGVCGGDGTTCDAEGAHIPQHVCNNDVAGATSTNLYVWTEVVSATLGGTTFSQLAVPAAPVEDCTNCKIVNSGAPVDMFTVDNTKISNRGLMRQELSVTFAQGFGDNSCGSDYVTEKVTVDGVVVDKYYKYYYVAKDCEAYQDSEELVSLEFGNNGMADYTYEGQNDPDISLCTNQNYEFKRVTAGHTLRVVKDSDCEECGSGSWSTLPMSSVSGWADVTQSSSHQITFNEAGTYYYVCTSHPNMVGKIEVSQCDANPNEFSWCHEAMDGNSAPQKQRSRIKYPAINGGQCNEEPIEYKNCNIDDIYVTNFTVSYEYDEDNDGNFSASEAIVPGGTVRRTLPSSITYKVGADSDWVTKSFDEDYVTGNVEVLVCDNKVSEEGGCYSCLETDAHNVCTFTIESKKSLADHTLQKEQLASGFSRLPTTVSVKFHRNDDGDVNLLTKSSSAQTKVITECEEDKCGLCKNSDHEWRCECPAGQIIKKKDTFNIGDDNTDRSHCHTCNFASGLTSSMSSQWNDLYQAEINYNKDTCDTCPDTAPYSNYEDQNDGLTLFTQCGILDHATSYDYTVNDGYSTGGNPYWFAGNTSNYKDFVNNCGQLPNPGRVGSLKDPRFRNEKKCNICHSAQYLSDAGLSIVGGQVHFDLYAACQYCSSNTTFKLATEYHADEQCNTCDAGKFSNPDTPSDRTFCAEIGCNTVWNSGYSINSCGQCDENGDDLGGAVSVEHNAEWFDSEDTETTSTCKERTAISYDSYDAYAAGPTSSIWASDRNLHESTCTDHNASLSCDTTACATAELEAMCTCPTGASWRTYSSAADVMCKKCSDTGEVWYNNDEGVFDPSTDSRQCQQCPPNTKAGPNGTSPCGKYDYSGNFYPGEDSHIANAALVAATKLDPKGHRCQESNLDVCDLCISKLNYDLHARSLTDSSIVDPIVTDFKKCGNCQAKFGEAFNNNTGVCDICWNTNSISVDNKCQSCPENAGPDTDPDSPTANECLCSETTCGFCNDDVERITNVTQAIAYCDANPEDDRCVCDAGTGERRAPLVINLDDLSFDSAEAKEDCAMQSFISGGFGCNADPQLIGSGFAVVGTLKEGETVTITVDATDANLQTVDKHVADAGGTYTFTQHVNGNNVTLSPNPDGAITLALGGASTLTAKYEYEHLVNGEDITETIEHTFNIAAFTNGYDSDANGVAESECVGGVVKTFVCEEEHCEQICRLSSCGANQILVEGACVDCQNGHYDPNSANDCKPCTGQILSSELNSCVDWPVQSESISAITEGEALSLTYDLSGAAPLTVVSVTKPDSLTVTLSGSTLTISGSLDYDEDTEGDQSGVVSFGLRQEINGVPTTSAITITIPITNDPSDDVQLCQLTCGAA